MFDADKLNEVAKPRSEKAIRLAKERKLKRQNDMTNEERAKFEANAYRKRLEQETTLCNDDLNAASVEVYDRCMKMAQWKDEQYEEMMNNYRRRIEELEHSISLITFVPENKK